MENRVFYLLLLVLALLVGFIAYFYKSKDTHSFNDVVKQANARLDSINAEVAKSRQLIQDTNERLENIQKSVGELKGKQATTNTAVSDNDRQMKEKVKEQEKELALLKTKYGKVQKERDLISTKLDSLADFIGGIQP